LEIACAQSVDAVKLRRFLNLLGIDGKTLNIENVRPLDVFDTGLNLKQRRDKV
jgi:hypothetical protein